VAELRLAVAEASKLLEVQPRSQISRQARLHHAINTTARHFKASAETKERPQLTKSRTLSTQTNFCKPERGYSVASVAKMSAGNKQGKMVSAALPATPLCRHPC
jgi:hypothetical protein